MITLQEFMNVVNFRITEGSNYGWNCYGPYAYCLDSWNGDVDGHSVSIVFDTKTQEVYEVSAYDYTKNRAYRLINPAYKSAHDAELFNRGVIDQAWELDDGTPVNYVDLETDEDFIDKATAIVEGIEYDTRVQVPLTLEKDQMYELMLLAHSRDMTLNQLVEEALVQEIERLENERH